jgi:drug/metabolite transporter (DMT)-like permease
MVLGAACLFGVNQPLSRVLIDGPLPARYLAASRLIALCVVFGAWTLVVYRDRLPRGRQLAEILAFGLLGIAILQWTLTEAIARIDVGLVLTFAYAASFPTAIWCRVVRHEHQPRVVWLAMFVAIVGLVLALGVGSDAFAALPAAGLAFATANCLLFAYYAVHGEKLLGRSPTPVVLGVGATAAAVFWTLTFAPLWAYPTAILTGDVSLGGNLSDVIVPGIAVLLYTTLAGTVLPYLLYLLGIGRIGPTRAVITGSIEPVIAVAAAWLWIDQRLTASQLVGCALVFGAVFMVQLARARDIALAR